MTQRKKDIWKKKVKQWNKCTVRISNNKSTELLKAGL